MIYWIFYFLRSTDIILRSYLDLKLIGFSQYVLKENLFSNGADFFNKNPNVQIVADNKNYDCVRLISETVHCVFVLRVTGT